MKHDKLKKTILRISVIFGIIYFLAVYLFLPSFIESGKISIFLFLSIIVPIPFLFIPYIFVLLKLRTFFPFIDKEKIPFSISTSAFILAFILIILTLLGVSQDSILFPILISVFYILLFIGAFFFAWWRLIIIENRGLKDITLTDRYAKECKAIIFIEDVLRIGINKIAILGKVEKGVLESGMVLNLGKEILKIEKLEMNHREIPKAERGSKVGIIMKANNNLLIALLKKNIGQKITFYSKDS